MRALLLAALAVLALAGCARAVAGTPAAPAAAPSATTVRAPGALPALRETVALAAPAVVAVDVNMTSLDFFLRPIEQVAAGSGVIIRPDGYVVTNDHVIAGASSIQVALADKRIFEATIVGRDSRSDLAVLKIDGTDLPHLSFASRDAADVGDWVLALGNALGLEGGPTVTVGIISAVGRTVRTASGLTLTDLIQTDAAINEGNSGGPLVNLQGEVVGINTTILAEAQGIGFAINSDAVLRFTGDLIEFGRVRRPLIGLQGRTLNRAVAEQFDLSVGSGVLVTGVAEGPASAAGIKPQDVILKFGGNAVTSWDQFLGMLWARRPGETITVDLQRGAEKLQIDVTLSERPAEGG